MNKLVENSYLGSSQLICEIYFGSSISECFNSMKNLLGFLIRIYPIMHNNFRRQIHLQELLDSGFGVFILFFRQHYKCCECSLKTSTLHWMFTSSLEFRPRKNHNTRPNDTEEMERDWKREREGTRAKVVYLSFQNIHLFRIYNEANDEN